VNSAGRKNGYSEERPGGMARCAAAGSREGVGEWVR